LQNFDFFLHVIITYLYYKYNLIASTLMQLNSTSLKPWNRR